MSDQEYLDYLAWRVNAMQRHLTITTTSTGIVGVALLIHVVSGWFL